MTVNEVIEELKYDCNELGKAIPCDTSWGESFENAYAMAINALEEVQQYRQIGTVEECRAAVEKQTAKKVKSIFQVKDGDNYVGLIGRCPCCGDILEEDTVYCDCGQRLDWEGER